MKVLIALLLLPLAPPTPAPVSPPTQHMQWDDTNAPGTLSGFNIYYGPSAGVYTNRLRLGVTTRVRVPLSTIPNGVFHSVVTVVNKVGIESEKSNELVWTNLYRAFSNPTNLTAVFVLEGSDNLSAWSEVMRGTNAVQITEPKQFYRVRMLLP